jgi:hypothetical protein
LLNTGIKQANKSPEDLVEVAMGNETRLQEKHQENRVHWKDQRQALKCHERIIRAQREKVLEKEECEQFYCSAEGV